MAKKDFSNPALHQKLNARAEARGRSLNDLIHTVLHEWADKNK